MRLLYIITIFILLAGCCTQRRCNQKFPPQVTSIEKDTSSNVSQELKQDSNYTTHEPADSSWIKLYLECDRNGQVIMRQLDSYRQAKNAPVPQVSVKNNMLTAQCKVDSLAVYHSISRHFKKEVQYKDRTIYREKTVVKNELNGFQRFCFWGFWILVPVFLLLSIKLLKSRVL